MSGRVFPSLLIAAALSGCGKEEPDEAAWAFEPILPGVANLDDDDGDGEPDWDGQGVSGENDRSSLTLPAGLFTGMGEEDSLQIDLGGDVEQIRVWKGGSIWMGGDGATSQTLSPQEADVALEIEFASFLVKGELGLTWLDADGAEVRSAQVTLWSAPLLLNHHLQPAERVWALKISGYNDEFIEGLEAGLGEDRLTTGNANKYDYDAWVQDEMELGTIVGAAGRMDVVIDSIRMKNSNGLDDFPEDKVVEEDTYLDTWGKGQATSQDSFGNLEASPPVTVDGVYYPFGRIYWGNMSNSWGLHEDMEALLESQKVQAPFQVDISWLCVGHVDEFTSFVPDTTSEKGFRFLIADTALGRELLESVDSEMYLPRFEADHHYATIGEILADDALWMLNEELQADYIDPALEIFTAELGLEESDIIRIPSVFEEYPGCGGATLALIPGTINMLVTQIDGEGPVKLFMPDPFLRTDVDDPSTDPMIAYTESVLPEGLEFHWIDDWEWYHLGMGEVHCGTNTRRTPIEDWWTAATHLLED